MAVLARLTATRPWQVVARTVKGTWSDGFMLAGNLAYLSLLTLFPFFIVVATVAGALGRTDDGLHAISAFLRTVPPDVGTLIAKPIREVIAARSQKGLLTLGILVTLWTVSGFIETIREIVRRAYGTTASRPVWEYRLGAMAMIVGAVVLMLIAFAVQVTMTAAEQFIVHLLPLKDNLSDTLGLSKLAPAAALFVALWGIFIVLTPKKIREGPAPIWPGPLLITAVWMGTTMLLPQVLGLFGGYNLTYGSLAGVIVALLFFYIIGLGLVVGAQLNAALAVVPNLRQNAAVAGAGA
ncbi:MAG: YihY/virulence factor BrkB family protein [Sphingomonadaceae bacterium]|nr:YihY/virulence factor BrkB family protein [Sphingomonadaceae bacterium]